MNNNEINVCVQYYKFNCDIFRLINNEALNDINEYYLRIKSNKNIKHDILFNYLCKYYTNFDELILQLCCIKLNKIIIYNNYSLNNIINYLKQICSIISLSFIKEYINTCDIKYCLCNNINYDIFNITNILYKDIKYKYFDNNSVYNVTFNELLYNYIPDINVVSIITQYCFNNHYNFIKNISIILNEFILYYCIKCNNNELINYIIYNSNQYYNEIKYNNNNNNFIFGLLLLYYIIKNDLNILSNKMEYNNINIQSKLDKIEYTLFDPFYYY